MVPRMTQPSSSRVWYVNAAGTAINWATAVTAGKATVDIFRLEDVPNSTNDRLVMFRKTGQDISAAQVSAAQAETSADAIPAQYIPAPGKGNRLEGDLRHTGSKVGFLGAPAVAKRPATPAATDLATVITLANALRADLIAFGLKQP